MIIDDGESSKGNRNTIFDPQFTYFGGFITKRGETSIASMYFSDINQFKVIEVKPVDQIPRINIISSDNKMPYSPGYGKIPTKKTTRSSTCSYDGKVFKKIITRIEYDDGTTS